VVITIASTFLTPTFILFKNVAPAKLPEHYQLVYLSNFFFQGTLLSQVKVFFLASVVATVTNHGYYACLALFFALTPILYIAPLRL
jgi:hypothetical protein